MQIADYGNCRLWELQIMEIADYGSCRLWELQIMRIAYWGGRWNQYVSDHHKTKKLASNMKNMIIPQRKMFWHLVFNVRTMGTLFVKWENKAFLNVFVMLEDNDQICAGFDDL